MFSSGDASKQIEWWLKLVVPNKVTHELVPHVECSGGVYVQRLGTFLEGVLLHRHLYEPGPLVPVLVGVERKCSSIIDKPLAAFSTPPYLLPTDKHFAIYNMEMLLSALGTDLESKSVPIPPFVIVDVL